jgi:selenocysteine lyase/cysteine desulfurase
MIGSIDADRLVETLAAERILCSARDGALRVSFHYYNTPQDVDAVLDALDRHADLVAHE